MSNELIKIELNLIDSDNNKLLCEEVFKMFNSVPQGMTTFQIQKFVLGDLEYPTPDSKWWQAKLELWVRMQNIISMHYDYRKKAAKINELKAHIEELEYNNRTCVFNDELSDIKKKQNSAKKEILNVEIEETEFALLCIKKGVSDKIKEMWAFWDVMNELEEHIEFSKINKDEQEETYWTEKAKITPELVNRYPEVFVNKLI
jgi:hypothetical protein